MPDFTDEEAARTDFGSYPAAAFYDDMFRLTRYRTDGALCERLVAESFPTLLWLAEKGVRFVPIFGRQSFMVDGKMKFWGGVVVESWGGGPEIGRGSCRERVCQVGSLLVVGVSIK